MLETKLNPEEEREYDQLRSLGQKLHIPIAEAFWTVEVFDKNGKLIQRLHQRSHSWVRNAYNLMFVQLAGKGFTGDGFGAGKLSLTETDSTVVDTAGKDMAIVWSGFALDTPGSAYNEHAGQIVHGILVGSGTNAESFEDYVLQTPIAEGAGGGQLNHAASEASAYSYGGTTGTNTLVRYFNNNSGGNVNINEVCLVASGAMGAATKVFLTARDKLGATVTVPDTGQCKVTYTIQLTYPS